MNRMIAAAFLWLPAACSSTSAPGDPTAPDAALDTSADASPSLPSDDAAPDVSNDTGHHEQDAVAESADAAHERASENLDDALAPTRDVTTDRATPSCIIEESSTLPHVRLVLRASACTFTLAEAQQGITVPYDLIIDEDVPGFTTNVYTYPPDAANLLIGARLSGSGQSYCYCDRGLPYRVCPSADGGVTQVVSFGDAQPWWSAKCDPFTIPAGIHHFAFTWHGRNWFGPSDTAQKEEAPFPPGDYELNIGTNTGTLPGNDAGALGAVARMRIHLLP